MASARFDTCRRSGVRLRSHGHGRHGFTIVEVVLVSVLIGIFASIAIPRYSGSISRRRIEAAAQRIAADLAMARRRALLTDAPQTVTFDIAADRYVHNGMKDLDGGAADYAVDLAAEPYAARLVYVDLTSSSESAGDTAVVFDIYGKPDSEGWIGVTVGSESRWIELNGKTGRVEITTVRPPEAPVAVAL